MQFDMQYINIAMNPIMIVNLMRGHLEGRNRSGHAGLKRLIMPRLPIDSRKGGAAIIAQFKVVPIGRGESLSGYVAECVSIVERSGLKYQLTPMATVVEGDFDEVMAVIAQCHKHVRKQSNRVVTSIEIDDRGGHDNAMVEKVQSVERKLKR